MCFRLETDFGWRVALADDQAGDAAAALIFAPAQKVADSLKCTAGLVLRTARKTDALLYIAFPLALAPSWRPVRIQHIERGRRNLSHINRHD